MTKMQMMRVMILQLRQKKAKSRIKAQALGAFQRSSSELTAIHVLEIMLATGMQTGDNRPKP